MVKLSLPLAIFTLSIPCSSFAQARGGPPPPPPTRPPGVEGSAIARGGPPSLLSSVDKWSVMRQNKNSPVEAPSGSVSVLDLKAPGKARHAYDKGYLSLMRKDFNDALMHFRNAISIYPAFVAAHNSLGSAYLELGQSRLARDQFAAAISLDDHLPSSYLNLGCAELALEDYASAVESVQKASALAPLDTQIMTTLSYAQFMNQDYVSVTRTARAVHGRKHNGAAMVHYYAAAAWQSQHNVPEMRSELETFLREDPQSPEAEQAQRTLQESQADALQQRRSSASTLGIHSPEFENKAELTAQNDERTLQFARQESREQSQVAEVEAAASVPSISAAAGLPDGTATAIPEPSFDEARRSGRNWGHADNSQVLFDSVVDEVAVMFVASEHGKPVTDLTRGDVAIRDARKPPAAITGFHNQSDLPLRLGIVVDTSDSVNSQLSFERRAAIRFVQGTLTSSSDLAFVVGVANSVLLVQDFTNNQQQLAHALNQLAPGGGTAVWDAVSFAAQKLASRAETEPVAKLLVVISDGKDNSSKATLKEAIESADLGEVFVYTLCTAAVGVARDPLVEANPNLIGPRAMKLLAERTGGASLAPRSLKGLDSTLGSIQELIRSRYLISYKPAAFAPDGTYRDIEVSASKSGHKLRVYARKGYYARRRSLSDLLRPRTIIALRGYAPGPEGWSESSGRSARAVPIIASGAFPRSCYLTSTLTLIQGCRQHWK